MEKVADSVNLYDQNNTLSELHIKADKIDLVNDDIRFSLYLPKETGEKTTSNKTTKNTDTTDTSVTK